MKLPKTEYLLIGGILITAATVGIADFLPRFSKALLESRAPDIGWQHQVRECQMKEDLLATYRPDRAEAGKCAQLAKEAMWNDSARKDHGLRISDLTGWIRAYDIDDRDLEAELSRMRDVYFRTTLKGADLKDYEDQERANKERMQAHEKHMQLLRSITERTEQQIQYDRENY